MLKFARRRSALRVRHSAAQAVWLATTMSELRRPGVLSSWRPDLRTWFLSSGRALTRTRQWHDDCYERTTASPVASALSLGEPIIVAKAMTLSMLEIKRGDIEGETARWA